MDDELFDFLERDLAGTVGATARWIPAWPHAAELANDEWSEAEAAHQLACSCGPDEIRAAYAASVQRLASLSSVDVRGILTSRLLRLALDELEPAPPAPVPVDRLPAPRRSGDVRRWSRRRQ